jgi:AcrR family transcriptional regulator
MPRPVNPERAPDFSRRRERAKATRSRVLEAARQLFTEGGYVATTIASIAERADVSAETIYATFGNKRTLLSQLVDISIAGGADARPVLEQEWVGRMREEPDPHRRIRMLATSGRAILERRAAVDDIVRAAASAEPEMASLRDLGKEQRFAGQRELLRIVVGGTGLRDGLAFDEAADILYALGSPDTWQLLVVDRGWSGARFESWYGETLARLLLEPPDRP